MNRPGPRYPVIVAAIAMLAIAVIIGLQLRDRSTTDAVAGASPTPSASATRIATGNPSATGTAVPSASVIAGGATPSDRYGFILGDLQNSFRLASETGAVLGSKQGLSPTVSLDGRRVAYWYLPTPAGGGEVRTFDPATPSDERTILTLPTTERPGGGIAWSSDGAMLVLAVYTVEANPGPDGGPKTAYLRTVSASGGAAQSIAQTTGRGYLPLGWDRASNVVAANELTGAGYTAYLAVRIGSGAPQVTRTALTGQVLSFQASPDATRVLAIWLDRNVVRIWPVAEFDKGYDVTPQGGKKIWTAAWRPRSGDVGWGLDDRLDLWTPQTDNLHTVYTSKDGVISHLLFRPDGTAARVVTGPAGNIDLLIDPQTGATATITPRGNVVGYFMVR